MASNKPIGIFDSGVGGTSIWREIHKILPHEDTIYLADSDHAPYGNKTQDRIIALSRKNTEALLNMGCKIIVVACNTATTNAIAHLRSNYDIPFIGIEPAIKPAALKSTSGSIGILATRGTLSSELFHRTSDSYTEGISVTEVVGDGLVSLIEAGRIDSDEMDELLRKYIGTMMEANVDHIVLGCSHYPYLIPKIKNLVSPGVKIIDSGEAVARQTKAVLQKNELLTENESPGTCLFHTNGDPEVLQQLIGDGFNVKKSDF